MKISNVSPHPRSTSPGAMAGNVVAKDKASENTGTKQEDGMQAPRVSTESRTPTTNPHPPKPLSNTHKQSPRKSSQSNKLFLPRRQELKLGAHAELGYNLATAATLKTHFLVATRGADQHKCETRMSFGFPGMTACTGLILCSTNGWIYGAHIPPSSLSGERMGGGLVKHLNLDSFIRDIRDNSDDKGKIQKAYFLGNSCKLQPAISRKVAAILGDKAAGVCNVIFPLSDRLNINENTAWVVNEVSVGAGGWTAASKTKVYQADLLATVDCSKGFTLRLVAKGYDRVTDESTEIVIQEAEDTILPLR